MPTRPTAPDPDRSGRSERSRAAARPRIVDGGLATALEEMGARLDSRLWSAGVFVEHPDLVQALHERYLKAGAEILIGASYQMSFEGLAVAGLGREQASRQMVATVEIARRAVASTGAEATVAASIGPYGATRCDGSEYRGDYGLGFKELLAFHRERFEVLRSAGADLLAIETLPSAVEARALRALLERDPTTRAWFSFSCRDDRHLADGTPIADVAAELDSSPQTVAIGVNCTAPSHVVGLMAAIRQGTRKPIVVYPNSGERWNAVDRTWSGDADADAFCAMAREWARRGAWAIGGCCRVGPELIRRLSETLSAPV